MELLSWVKNPIPGTEFTLYMRSTPTNHGVVIDPFGGNYLGDTELTGRRYSVYIKYLDGSVRLAVGSVSYDRGFDSEDPAEPFRKYLNGEFDVLMSRWAAPGEAESISDWDGSAQALNRMG